MSIWLLDVRSPRSDAPCHGGDRHGAFIQTQGNCMSVRSLGVNMGFTQPLGALVLTCFERVYRSRNRIDWLGGKDRRFAFDTEGAKCLLGLVQLCTVAKWCLLIAVGSTSWAMRPTSSSLCWYAAKLRNGHHHLGAAELVRHHLQGSWRPRSRTEHEQCCSITCELSHVFGYMNF